MMESGEWNDVFFCLVKYDITEKQKEERFYLGVPLKSFLIFPRWKKKMIFPILISFFSSS
jgi:hypothetical protein